MGSVAMRVWTSPPYAFFQHHRASELILTRAGRFKYLQLENVRDHIICPNVISIHLLPLAILGQLKLDKDFKQPE